MPSAAGRGQGRALVKRRRTDAARYPRNLRLVATDDLLALAAPSPEHDAEILRRLLELNLERAKGLALSNAGRRNG